jgi:hypothetical protein
MYAFHTYVTQAGPAPMSIFDNYTFQRKNKGLCPLCDKPKENRLAAYCYACMREYRRYRNRIRMSENIPMKTTPMPENKNTPMTENKNTPMQNTPMQNTPMQNTPMQNTPMPTNKCPKCGLPKKPEYPTCFICSLPA